MHCSGKRLARTNMVIGKWFDYPGGWKGEAKRRNNIYNNNVYYSNNIQLEKAFNSVFFRFLFLCFLDFQYLSYFLALLYKDFYFKEVVPFCPKYTHANRGIQRNRYIGKVIFLKIELQKHDLIVITAISETLWSGHLNCGY